MANILKEEQSIFQKDRKITSSSRNNDASSWEVAEEEEEEEVVVLGVNDGAHEAWGYVFYGFLVKIIEKKNTGY